MASVILIFIFYAHDQSCPKTNEKVKGQIFLGAKGERHFFIASYTCFPLGMEYMI